MNDEILERLEKLENAKDEFQHDPEHWNYISYGNALALLIDNLKYHELLTKGNLRFTAIDYYIDYKRETAGLERDFDVPLLHALFELLHPADNLKYLIKKPDSDAALVYYFLNYSVLCIEKFSTGYTKAFKGQLAYWTGITGHEDAVPDPEYVCTQLYGYACWDLYGIDLKSKTVGMDIRPALRNIINARLPLIFKQVSTEKQISFDIPNNFA